MKLIKENYAELLHLTQLFLLREYSLKEIKLVDPAIVNFFRERAPPSAPSLSSKKIPPTAPILIEEAQVVNEEKIFLQKRQQESQAVKSPVPPSSPPFSSTPPESVKPLQSPPPIVPLEAVALPGEPAITNKDKINKSKEFSLEPFSTPHPKDNSEGWKLYSKIFPDWSLSKTIPNDEVALKNKNAWQKTLEISPVLILAFHNDEQQLTFLKNIAQAISLRLAPTRVISASQIEKENGWEKILHSPLLRLVIAGDYGLYLHPKLMQFYREVPQQGKHFINQTPLLLLSDLSLYLKEPQLKSLLWRAICNEFSASTDSFKGVN